LHIAGVRPGDEVLVPAFTFAASANAVLGAGAHPVFVDIDEGFLIDLGDAQGKLTERTRAIMPVHLYGLMVDMIELSAFADRHGLVIVEDAAQAHLARRGGVSAGGTGVGAFSLYATKNMMSGEGGIVSVVSDGLAEKAKLFRNHGMATRYEHVEWGLNLRLTELQAAIARVQLEKLPAATEVRRRQAKDLTAGLPRLFEIPRVPDDAYHVFHQFTVRVPAPLRTAVVDAFHAEGIGVDIYYPTPVNRQPAFVQLGVPDDCPKAAQAASEVISLPVHPKVGREGVARIIETAERIAEEMA
jgi:dTDP-4-amino-4,6-dideoxygalactose transaminase